MSGHVFFGVYGESTSRVEKVPNAVVQLFLDDGDRLFDTTKDVLKNTQTTGADGDYSFERLTAGDYFLRQIPGVYGGKNIGSKVSEIVSISPLDAQGVSGTTIDSFGFGGAAVAAPPAGGQETSASTTGIPENETVGGVRKIRARNANGDAGTANLQVDGGLFFNATNGGRGVYTIVWDATANSAPIEEKGMGGIDLTSGGSTAYLKISAVSNETPSDPSSESSNTQMRFRVYSGAGNFSQTQPVSLPFGDASAPVELIMPFSQFQTIAGTGGDFARAGALEMQIDQQSDAPYPSGIHGRVASVQIVGSTVKTFDFINGLAPSLTLYVDNDQPAKNEVITFTLTTTDMQIGDATAIDVLHSLRIVERLPAGIAFISATSTAGDYDHSSGVWTIPSFGRSATLEVKGKVITPGTKVGTATLEALDEVDLSSLNIVRNVSIVPRVVDVAVQISVDKQQMFVGETLQFSVTVSNAAATTATGLVVHNEMPPSFVFVSSGEEVNYDPQTGDWTVPLLGGRQMTTLNIWGVAGASGAAMNVASIRNVDQFDAKEGDDRDSATVEVMVIVIPPEPPVVPRILETPRTPPPEPLLFVFLLPNTITFSRMTFEGFGGGGGPPLPPPPRPSFPPYPWLPNRLSADADWKDLKRNASALSLTRSPLTLVADDDDRRPADSAAVTAAASNFESQDEHVSQVVLALLEKGNPRVTAKSSRARSQIGDFRRAKERHAPAVIDGETELGKADPDQVSEYPEQSSM